MKEWAVGMVNLLFSYASDRRMSNGSYSAYAREKVDSLLALCEDDLCEICPLLNSEEIVRLSMALYLMKSSRYENIWWRVENRVHDLAEEKGALDSYHISSIIRSFSKSQDNIMAGSDKLFYHLEPLIIK